MKNSSVNTQRNKARQKDVFHTHVSAEKNYGPLIFLGRVVFRLQAAVSDEHTAYIFREVHGPGSFQFT